MSILLTFPWTLTKASDKTLNSAINIIDPIQNMAI